MSRRLRHAVRGGVTRLKLRREDLAGSSEDSPDAGGPGDAAWSLLRVETADLSVPAAIRQAGDEATNGRLFGPVTIGLITLAIAFILTIAWFVSQMEPPAR